LSGTLVRVRLLNNAALRHVRKGAICNKMNSLFRSREFLVFVLCGATSALLNWSSRILFQLVVGFETAVALAYLVGMTSAFILFRTFVFAAQDGSTRGQALRFVLVNIWGMAQTVVLSHVAAVLVLRPIMPPAIADAIAHAVALGMLAVTSFIMHKFFTFVSQPHHRI
jgi:putative flippase GtrA